MRFSGKQFVLFNKSITKKKVHTFCRRKAVFHVKAIITYINQYVLKEKVVQRLLIILNLARCFDGATSLTQIFIQNVRKFHEEKTNFGSKEEIGKIQPLQEIS
jgi:hypothetical protein